MGLSPGNFEFHTNTILAEELEQQPNKFGYITQWTQLLIDSTGRLYVEADANVQRDAHNSPPNIFVRALKGGGFEIALLGDDVLSSGAPCDKEPSKTAIPVRRIKVGAITYSRWDDELRYHSILTMPIGGKEAWFIERYRLANSKEGFVTSRLSDVKSRKTPTRVPVRRVSEDNYEVQMPRRGWVTLKLA